MARRRRRGRRANQKPKGKRGRPRKNKELEAAVLATILDEQRAQAVKLSDQMAKTAEAIKANNLIYIGTDQRSTKSIGNYETFVFGFSLGIPIQWLPEDDIENPETKKKLRQKYEAVSNFISEMMSAVEGQVESATLLLPPSSGKQEEKPKEEPTPDVSEKKQPEEVLKPPESSDTSSTTPF